MVRLRFELKTQTNQGLALVWVMKRMYQRMSERLYTLAAPGRCLVFKGVRLSQGDEENVPGALSRRLYLARGCFS